MKNGPHTPPTDGAIELPDFVLSSRTTVIRAFASWFATQGPRFRFPLKFIEVKAKTLYFDFEGVHPSIRAFVFDGGIEVCATWGQYEEIVDYLWWGSNVGPQRNENGWFDALTEPEYFKHYRTREELYVKESFEPFLEWVNGKLAKARWLCLSCSLARGERYWSGAEIARSRAQGQKFAGGNCFFLPLRFNPR